MIVSADADGVVKVWDIRMIAELGTIETGSFPINKVAIDRGGFRAVAASDDGEIKVINLLEYSIMSKLTGHEGAVQCVGFSPNDAFMVSGSSDTAVKVWG
jgi:WD40 repeat protein